MGKRGPPPKPTALLRLAGSWRADARKDEPVVKPKIPFPPKWLNELPAEVTLDFKATARQLHNSKLIGDLDAQPLARLCYLRYRFKIAVTELEDSCHVEQGEKGSSMTGEFKSVKELTVAIDRMERTFGITPSGRAGLATIGSTKKDKSNSDLEAYRNKTG